MSGIDPSKIGEYLAGIPPWVAPTVGGLAALVVVAFCLWLIWRGVTRQARRLAHAAQHVEAKKTNLKLEVGFAVVQAGLSWIVVTGVFEYFHRVLAMPWPESAALAVFIEAALWTSVGFILDHGRRIVEKIQDDGTTVTEHAKGWGIAGPLFWLISVAGGILALLAAGNARVAVGRAIIVVIGTALWVVRLLRATHRSGRRSRFRYSPRRLMESWGWIEPEPEEQDDENRAWRVARLARAIRWSNGRWGRGRNWRTITAWLGDRALTKLAESTKPDVLQEAQQRAASVHVLRSQASYKSEVMKAIIAAQEVTATRVAQLVQQHAIADARTQRAIASGADTVAGFTIPMPALTGERPAGPAAGPDPHPEVLDRDETPPTIAGQVEKDRQAAVAIFQLVRQLAGDRNREYVTWDDVRSVIATEQLLNKIERASKETELPMGKPKIKRILERADQILEGLPVDGQISA